MNVESFIGLLRNPQAYVGGEINSCRRAFAREDINVCLVFPEPYAIGMSHPGLKILYHQLNRMEGVHAQRAFLPEPENIPLFREYGMPLFSLENRIPLGDFDLIGFSLLSELNFTNVLQVLEMSGLEALAARRRESDPWVAAGGIAVANPEPMRNFVDLFAFGDGEVIFPDLIDILRRGRRDRPGREALRREFDRIEGIYVPALYPLRAAGSFLVPAMGGKTVRKRVCPDLDRVPAEPAEIVPVCDVVFNRLNVEIARGCPQNCRFCQAKSYYAPFRVRAPQPTLEFIKDSLAATGFETFSLASLSSGDYPHLPELLRRIPGAIQPDISFSVPSLRPSTLSPGLLATLSMFRKTGITIVPEAGSERLRRVISKNVTDEEVFQALDIAVAHGWRKVKMYFMLGLPGETAGDVEAIAQLLEGILGQARSRKARLSIHASFSSFVPKPHTPLQWAARASVPSLEEKASFLRSRLRRHKNLDLDFHSSSRSMVETVLARGDARIGDVLLEAFRRGEIFTAWDSHFHLPAWEEALRKVDGAVFLGGIPLEAELPWDFVRLNFHKDFLAAEYRRSLAAEPTRPCSERDCASCAGCLFGQAPHAAPSWSDEEGPPPAPPAAYRRLRLFYPKCGDLRFLSHLSMMQYLERLLRRSGLRFKYSEGFHPRLKMASLSPLPVGAEGENEVIEVAVAGELSATEVLAALNRAGRDFRFVKAEFVRGEASFHKGLQFVDFRFSWPPGQEPSGPESASRREEIASLLGPGDVLTFAENGLGLRMDFAHQGQERFARVYRLLDPERRWTSGLRRLGVVFKNEA
ncbi:MAG: TIGR03960 family B12-binding radical SAM protein [Candidatus Aminicenantes bacterium]|nr:TIGR03960 family B12-binding radical SAM protein [Candidatus Aminicenantes bacterium]